MISLHALVPEDAVNILNTLNDAVMVLDLEGLVLYANPSSYRLFEREVLVGKNCGLPISSAGESIEVQLVRSGGTGWAQLRSAPIQWAKQFAIVITLSDITELKRVQRRITKSEARFRAMFESIPFMAWMKDTQSRFTHINSHWVQFIGINGREKVIGKSDFDLWPDELAEHYRHIDQEVMHTRQQKRLVEKTISNLDRNLQIASR